MEEHVGCTKQGKTSYKGLACRNIFQVCAFLSSANNYQFRFRIFSELAKYLNTRQDAFTGPPQTSPYRRTYHYI